MDLHQLVLTEGFAIIPSALPLADVVGILDSLKQLGVRRSRAGARHILSHPAVAATAHSAPMIAIAREILGPHAFPFRATLFDKSQTANWLVAWHQDTALPLRLRRETPGWGPWSVKDGVAYAHAPAETLEHVLALRLHLDDSNSRNGPLRVLPTTRRLGVLNDERVHELSSQIRSIECVAPVGGVLAMRPLVVHASSKSHRSSPRRVLHFEYAASPSVAAPLELALV